MNDLTIEVQRRETLGKNANRRLRTTGQVPAVVYGAGRDPLNIQVEAEKVEQLLKSGSGENTVFLLKLAGTDQSRHTMIRELQTDAITGEMIHIDFLRILLDQKVRVMVPVKLEGEAPGVKTDGGMLDFITRELELECLPNDIPRYLTADISDLRIGQHLEARQLELPEEVTLLGEPERVLVSVAQSRVAVEEEEEGDELLETASPEPEVVGQGKAEEAE
jgi:large subunit ribosomal protein L25